MRHLLRSLILATFAATTTGTDAQTNAPADAQSAPPAAARFIAQPLTRDIYVADPSAHVFNNRIYVYGSHDVDAGIPDDDLGSEYAMHDYRVLSMDRIGGPVTVHPIAIDVKSIPWAAKQTWAPDAAYKNGTYYLYIPARDPQGIFRIGVATSASPVGPFTAEPAPIKGSFSIDPAVFTDKNGESYMYFGGIWGGQLQRWANGQFDPNAGDTDLKQDDKPALTAKVARMTSDMKQFAEPPRDVVIVDQAGKPLLGGDHDRRFFEASWMFRRGDKYYFTYSTGDTHFIAYAIGDNPYGPFRYAGHILLPVQGWTTHHSIVKVGDSWKLFYHDTQMSNRNHLRSAKVTDLRFNPDGTIRTINPFRN